MPRQAFDFSPQTQEERDAGELYNMVVPNSKDHWDIMPREVMMELSCRGMHSGEFLGLTFNAPPYFYRLILVPRFTVQDGHFDLRLRWEELTEDVPKFSGASDAIRRHVSYCTYMEGHFKGDQTLRHFRRRIAIRLIKSDDGRSYLLKEPDSLDWLVCNREPTKEERALETSAKANAIFDTWVGQPAQQQDNGQKIYTGHKALDEMQRRVLEQVDVRLVLQYLQTYCKAESLIIKVSPKEIGVHRIVRKAEKISLDDL